MLSRHSMMQLFLALLASGVLLVSLTALLATGRFSFSQNAAWLLAAQASPIAVSVTHYIPNSSVLMNWP